MEKETVVPALRTKRRFFEELNVSPQTGYQHIINGPHPPKIVRIGTREFVAESGAEYAARLAELQATEKVAA